MTAFGSFTLGTAQLGLTYGIANASGMPAKSRAIEIVRTALRRGVRSIDTARAYGSAEERVGEALLGAPETAVRVITKLDPLADLSPNAGGAEVRAAVDLSVRASSEALRVRQLPTLLLHRWAHRTAYGGAIWHRLRQHVAEGTVQSLGASVYTPAEAVEALGDPDVHHLQIPFNILDWRWRVAGIQKLAIERPDVCIHARSALLQGLLAAEASVWSRLAAIGAEPFRDRLDRLVATLRRRDRADLCFAYVRAQSWISGIVVGVETVEQLRDSLGLFEQTVLTPEECGRAEKELTGAPDDLLNPARWQLTH